MVGEKGSGCLILSGKGKRVSEIKGNDLDGASGSDFLSSRVLSLMILLTSFQIGRAHV